MANPISRFLRKLRYGEPVVIVSGLPRSGTSMMMKMLEAGGLPIMTDHERSPDEDNPKGYYEYERVKHLEKETDRSWVRRSRGKVLKVISHLLRFLPDENDYRVILMRRDLDEVIASQNKMLDRLGEDNPIDDDKAKDLFRKHLISAKVVVQTRSNFAMLEARFDDALQDPRAFAARVNEFLGGSLDADRMAEVVDPALYRQRKDKLQEATG